MVLRPSDLFECSTRLLGCFDRKRRGQGSRLRPRQIGEEAWKPSEEDENEGEDAGVVDEDQADTFYRSEIKIRRLGEFRFPTEIEIVFEDGETVREQWNGQEAWTKLTFVRSTKLASATVDPDRNVPLDVNYTNDSRTLEPQKLGITKVATRWMFWWQFLLDLVSL